MDMEDVNHMTGPEFLECFAAVYEHSPWVAERVLLRRPFAGRDAMVEAMRGVVDAASDEEKMALIRAHPDLAGKLARAGRLTEESTREQAGLGLDRLGDDEYERFSALNESYRRRFGFPFIICARMTTKQGVLDAFEKRLKQEPAAEVEEALRQIHHIARLRIEDKVG